MTAPRLALALLAALPALAVVAGCSGSSPAATGTPADPSPVDPAFADRITTATVASTAPGIASRAVQVLVPPGYDDPASAGVRYPVLYMHDGNACLDRDDYGHGGWQVHRISTQLVEAGQMAPVIVVMVVNSSRRAEEYVPGLGNASGPTAEAYLDYLEHDVVPWVEARYRTAAGPGNRALGGSSFGGLISLYGAWTRPGVWGRVMAMSPAYAYDFPGQVRAAQAPYPALRIYLDSGTIDWGGGDDFRAATEGLRDLLVQDGWTLGQDLFHAVGEGQNHDESAWRARLPGALPLVFPPET